MTGRRPKSRDDDFVFGDSADYADDMAVLFGSEESALVDAPRTESH